MQWKELTPEEKEVPKPRALALLFAPPSSRSDAVVSLWIDGCQHYVQLAVKDKERYEKERLENPVEVEEQGGDEDENQAAKESHACMYPLGT